jgi:hypothetical protein
VSCLRAGLTVSMGESGSAGGGPRWSCTSEGVSPLATFPMPAARAGVRTSWGSSDDAVEALLCFGESTISRRVVGTVDRSKCPHFRPRVGGHFDRFGLSSGFSPVATTTPQRAA